MTDDERINGLLERITKLKARVGRLEDEVKQKIPFTITADLADDKIREVNIFDCMS